MRSGVAPLLLLVGCMPSEVTHWAQVDDPRSVDVRVGAASLLAQGPTTSALAQRGPGKRMWYARREADGAVMLSGTLATMTTHWSRQTDGSERTMRGRR